MTTPFYQTAFQAYRAGDWAHARLCLESALSQSPLDAQSLLLLAVVQEKEDAAAALCLAEQAVMRGPDDAVAWYNLGVIEAERGNFEGAVQCYSRCVAIQPTHLDALGNGCELLRRLELFEQALAWADVRMVGAPNDWRGHLNRAVCLVHLSRMQEAEEAFAHAQRLGEGQSIIAWERFSMLLYQNRFAEAWDAFEHRFAVGHLNGVFHYPFKQPQWRGETLHGKHILVHNEQGLGDQIMFACALPEVIAAAGAVTLVVAPTLVPVFAASFPTARVLPCKFGRSAGDHPAPDWIGTLGAVDYQAPIGSLMAVLRRDPATFANPQAYLRPSDEARQRWRDFQPGGRLKVGVCWASNPALFRRDSANRAVKKSMRFDELEPLSNIRDAELVSVLNWPIEGDAGFGQRVIDVSDRLVSFDDTAALIERLDVVVTVDTSVAHMSGALGKETWLLLHDFPDCRWGLTGETSYWYKNMRLFRQHTLGDWAPVVADVALALRERLAS